MKVNINKNNFEEEVIKANKPVLVDFFATWCAPCKMMSPILDKISEKYADKLKVGVIDIDDNMNLAEKYHVISVPNFKIFVNGEVEETFVGAMSEDELENKIKEYIK